MPGQGGLVLTGQLGDVMKESARIALNGVQPGRAIDRAAFDVGALGVELYRSQNQGCQSWTMILRCMSDDERSAEGVLEPPVEILRQPGWQQRH